MLRDLRGLPRPVWVLAGGTLVNRFGGFVLVFLTLYLTRQGLSVQQAGLVVGAYGLGKLTAAVLGGQLADRLGARRVTVLSMFASSASTLLLWQVHGFALTAAVAALTGLAAELYRPSTTLLMVETVPDRQRVTAFGVYQLATNIGTTTGPAVAGLLATHSYTWLFVGDSLTSAAWGVLALSALPRDRPTPARAVGAGRAAGVIARDRAFLRYLLAVALLNLVLFQTLSTFPLWVRDHGISAGGYGLLMAGGGALAVLGLPLSALTRRRPAPRMLGLAAVLVAVGFGLVALADRMPLLVLCVVVWTFGDLMQWPVSAAYVARIAPAGLVGRYAGARSLVYGLAATLAPTLGTALYGVDPTVVWPVCFVLAATSGVLFARPARADEPPPGDGLSLLGRAARASPGGSALHDPP